MRLSKLIFLSALGALTYQAVAETRLQYWRIEKQFAQDQLLQGCNTFVYEKKREMTPFDPKSNFTIGYNTKVSYFDGYAHTLEETRQKIEEIEKKEAYWKKYSFYYPLRKTGIIPE